MIQPADPKPFSVRVSTADVVRLSRRLSGKVNASEFRGWRPGSIMLIMDAGPIGADGRVCVTLQPQPTRAIWKFIDPAAPSGVNQAILHDMAEFSFLEQLPGYTPPRPIEPTAAW